MVDKTNRIAVIGAGFNGMATTRNLAETGYAVDVYERKQAAAVPGGSHCGATRAIRVAQPEGMHKTLAVRDTYGEWDRIGQAAQEILASRNIDKTFCLKRNTGFLIIQAKVADTVTAHAGVHDTKDYIESAVALSRQVGIAYDDNTERLVQQFPQFLHQPDARRFYAPNDGVLFVADVLEAQWVVAAEAGARFFFDTIVRNVSDTPTGAVVSSRHGDIEYDAVVVAPGSWLPDFAPPDLKAQTEIYAQTQYFVEIEQPELFADLNKQSPGFIYSDGRRNWFYGFPIPHDTERRGMRRYLKVAGEQFRQAIARPENMPRDPVKLKNEISPIKLIEDAVSCYLSGGNLRRAKVRDWVNCPYTMHKKFGHDFAITKRGHIWYVLACGGQAAKLSMHTGRELAKSVVQEAFTNELAPYADDRTLAVADQGLTTCSFSSPPPAPAPARPLPPGFSVEYPDTIVSGSLPTNPSLQDALIPK